MDLATYFAAERGRGAQLARSVGESQAFLSQIASGHRPCPPKLAPAIERETGGAVMRWDLLPNDWHLYWDHLIGTEGAPAVPTPTEKAAQ